MALEQDGAPNLAQAVYASFRDVRAFAGFDDAILGSELATRNTGDFEGTGIECLNPWLD